MDRKKIIVMLTALMMAVGGYFYFDRAESAVELECFIDGVIERRVD